MADQDKDFSLESRVTQLEDDLTAAQDNLLATEAVLRALMQCLYLERAVPLDRLQDTLRRVAFQGLRDLGEDFPGTTEAVKRYRAFADGLGRDAPGR